MKRSPLGRRTPLRRHTRINPVNRKRKAERFARDYGERGEAVRAMACLAETAIRTEFRGMTTLDQLADAGRRWTRCRGPVVAAHVRSRGAGGDRRSLVPLCQGHHDEQHHVGVKRFAERYRLDLEGEAERVASELDARGLA